MSNSTNVIKFISDSRYRTKPEGYSFSGHNESKYCVIPLSQILFLGDDNARGSVEYTQSTLDEFFMSSIESQGVVKEIHVVPLPQEGGVSKMYLALDGMRRAMCINSLYYEGKKVGGQDIEELSLKCLVRYDVDPYDESQVDSLQLQLNDHKAYSQSAYSKIINKYLDKGKTPSQVSRMLGVSRQHVGYYSSLGKDKFAFNLVDKGQLSVSAGRDLIKYSKDLCFSTEDFWSIVVSKSEQDNKTKITANYIFDVYKSVCPRFNRTDVDLSDVDVSKIISDTDDRHIDHDESIEYVDNRDSEMLQVGSMSTPILDVPTLPSEALESVYMDPTFAYNDNEDQEYLDKPNYIDIISNLVPDNTYTKDKLVDFSNSIVMFFEMGMEPNEFTDFIKNRINELL